MKSRAKGIVFATALLLAGPLVLVSNAQKAPGPTKVVLLTGFEGVKNNTKGTLAVEGGNLHFVHAKINSDVAVTSIQDVVTGNDSQRVFRGTAGTLTEFGPYGSGRFLSLFRSPIETLTIRYRDADGGLHGAIFTMPVGQADPIKSGLVAQGAHTSVPTQADANPSGTKGQKP